MKERICLFAAVALVVLIAGCSHPLSRDAFYSVDYTVDYMTVKADPQAHIGKTLMLGGMIMENRSGREGTVLEVLCYTLDRYDKPKESNPECGRFLAKTHKVLDGEHYRPGRLVTLTGTLVETRKRPLGEATYTYLNFEIGEIYLWPEPRPYDHYYHHYPYGTYPYWHRYPYHYW